jgi:hypothetical protein
MKRIAIGLLLVPALLTAQAAPASKVDVSGKWTLTVQSDNGTSNPQMTMVQKGDSITGHYTSQLLGELDFKGSVKGNEVIWVLNTNIQGQALAATYKATVDQAAGTMKGSADFGGYASATFTATKAKP